MDADATAMAPWFDLCHRASVSLANATNMGAQLVAAYGEPQRHYHTLAHVLACLELAGDMPLDPEEAIKVEFALWFHDVVYDPTRSDNEAASAALAVAWMQDMELAGGSDVEALIEMTAGHVVGSDAGLGARVVHDVDLSILGADEDRYRRYVDEIRAEYGWLDDDAWSSGRRQVLTSFLEMERIYCLPAYVSAFEAPARRNIARELSGEWRRRTD